MRTIKHIVVHCSATPDGKAVGIEDIDRMHREKGWRMVGYHYVIELDGSVMTGRDLEEVGAHVEGDNAHSVGICLIGTTRFSVEQLESLADEVRDLEERYPEAVICGHRDFSPDLNGDGVISPNEWFKLCPGFDVVAWRLSGMDPLWNPAHVWA